MACRSALGVSAHLGHGFDPNYLTIGKEYTDWNIGATYTWSHLTFGVSYVDTNKDAFIATGRNISKAGVVGSITASFQSPDIITMGPWSARIAAFFLSGALRVACTTPPPYSGSMPAFFLLSIFLATVAAMEGFAYVMHRWVMHGPGWFLHASHHRPRKGSWEANDLYFVIFAMPSILLLLGGVQWGWGDWATVMGAGIAAYGAIYLGFHDIIVHRRVTHRYVPRSSYMKRIVQAHRLHHAVETKQGCVSFGFLIAPRPNELKRALARNKGAEVRTARRR